MHFFHPLFVFSIIVVKKHKISYIMHLTGCIAYAPLGKSNKGEKGDYNSNSSFKHAERSQEAFAVQFM